jgi:hypothetical protein
MNRRCLWLIAAAALPGFRFGSVRLARDAGERLEETSRRRAVDVYVDPAGDDAATGRSPSTAWRRLARVEGMPCDRPLRVWLKRGGAWDEGLAVPCSDFQLDAYGEGAAPVLNGADSAVAWTSRGGGVYRLTDAPGTEESAGNVADESGLFSFVPWTGTGTLAAASNRSFTIDPADDSVWVKTATTPTGGALTVSRRRVGVTADGKSGVSVRHLRIRRFSLHGVQFKDCVNCVVADLVVEGVGGARVGLAGATPIHAGNGVEFANACRDGAVDRLSTTDIFDSGLTVQTFDASRAAIGFVWRDVAAVRCGFAGVELSVLSNGGATGSSVSDVRVASATISSSGDGWSGRRYGTEGHGVRVMADAGAGHIAGVVLSDVSVSGSAGDGVALAGSVGTVVVERARLSGNARGISALDAAESTLRVTLTSSILDHNRGPGLFVHAPAAQGFDARHNTFHENAVVNVMVLGGDVRGRLKGNIFSSDVGSPHLYVQSRLTEGVDRNDYVEAAGIIGYNGSAYDSVSAFRAGAGQEAQGIGGSPAFFPRDGIPYALSAGSPCRGAGSPVDAPAADFTGTPFASPPSLGALEFR